MSTWEKIAELAAIPERSIVPLQAGGRDLIVLREGLELRCFLDRCSHQNIKLSEFGQLAGAEIVCLAHGARFSCDSGEALSFPARCGLEAFELKIEEGTVFMKVSLPSPVKPVT